MIVDYKKQTKARLQIVLAILFGLSIMAGIWLLYNNAIFSKTPSAKPANSKSFTIDQSATYDVLYNDSSYFGSHYVAGYDQAYISDLIKTISPHFSYTYQTNDKVLSPTKFNSVVTAEIDGAYTVKGDSSNSTVWKKTTLLSTTNKQSSSSPVTITDNPTLDYQTFNSTVKQFQNDLGIPIQANLVINRTISLTGVNSSNHHFSDSQTAQLTIPLNQQVLKITSKVEPHLSRSTLAKTPTTSTRPQHLPLIIILIGLGVIGLVSILLWRLSGALKKTPYQKELNRIFRYHDAVILRTTKAINKVGKTIIPVKSFDDMLDLADELKQPIVASQINDEYSEFIILHNNVIYLYALGKNPRVNIASLGIRNTPSVATHLVRTKKPTKKIKP